jgi:Double-GTPase 2
LADWHRLAFQRPITLIEPINSDTQDLIAKIEYILMQGDTLEPTCWYDELDLPIYELLVEIKPSLRLNPILWILRRRIRFHLTLQDYAGEFVSELAAGSNNKFLEHYLDSCAIASGLLFMIDGSSSPQHDREYASAISNLRREISQRLGKGNRKKGGFRIAFVLSKVDQPNVYPYRNSPSQFISRNFPRSINTMRAWNEAGYQVSYFACSSFGMYGNPEKPNAINGPGISFAIKHPDSWKPIGITAPIYWLSVGKNDRRLWNI